MLKLLKKEWNHYHSLSKKARLLILSYNFRSIAQPILTIFINAFIWRTTTSITSVIIYNLGYFLTLPLAFFINGKLLKKINIEKTHFIGLVFSILGLLLVIFSKSSSIIYLLIFGTIYGFGNGIYWANKNYLDGQETETKMRTYYFSISSVASSIINIIVTFLAGWIIAYSEISKLYSPFAAYAGVAIFATICIFIAGFIVLNSGLNTPIIKNILRPKIDENWGIVRAVNFSVGIFENIIPIICGLLILNFIGKEGELGTIAAIVTILTIFLQYLYGRLSKKNYHKNILIIVLIISIILASTLAFGKSNLTILIYVLLAQLPSSFYWLIFKPWQLGIIDKASGTNTYKKYPLFVDIEIFLNIGRIFGILIFWGLIHFLPNQIALRSVPLVLIILQTLLFAIFWKKIIWKN